MICWLEAASEEAQSRVSPARERHLGGDSTRLVSDRYHDAVAMTLRLTEEEQVALRRRAAEEGISMQDAARQAVRLYVGLQSHRDRVFAAAQRVMEAHADALDRLGR